MIKIIFFDIDGTLLEMGKTSMLPSTLNALEELKQKDIKIIIATGRSPLRMPDIEFPADGYINFNGQLCQIDGRIIHENHLEKDDILQVLNNAKEMGRCVAISGKRFFGCNGYDERLAMYLRHTRPDYPILEDFSSRLNETIFQMVVAVSKNEENLLFQNTSSTKAVRWSDEAADIIPIHGGKGVGIRKILDVYGFSPDEAAAFGDGENDIQMLETVGLGIAMGNAKEIVKQHAKYVTDSVNEDGIAKALKVMKII